MTGMSNTDYQLFTTIAKMKQKTLLKSMNNFLKKYYDKEKMTVTSDYILCEGNIPVMVVAHMDTVFKAPPTKIYYDQRQHVMWSPDGLGADDRAGVFAIMKIIQHGYRPHVCFTTDEESGGLGARVLIKEKPQAPFNIKYIIQLDRQGSIDCVFYSCENVNFQEYVEQYGFITDWGSFSDISVICPRWKIAGVNLSVGYLNEHSKIETLHTDALYSTIHRVEEMMNDIKEAPCFEYIHAPYDGYWKKLGLMYGWDWDDDDDDWYEYHYTKTYPTGPYKCVKCGRSFTEDDVFPVKSKDDGSIKYYCIDCVSSNVNWCDKCGEPFETTRHNASICPDCANKNK